jgi:two-component system nitrate/nitrite response regulator NarL
MHADDGVDSAVGNARPSVFIVTPIRLYRDGIAHFLRSSGKVEVLGAAKEGATTIRLAVELLPDVILLDMELEESRQTAWTLRAAVPGAAVVALAVPESEDHVIGCAEAGIAGYVPREASLDELLATLIRAVNGEATCSPRIAGGLFRRIAALAGSERGAPGAADGHARLTAREAEVVALIDDGLSNKQIARELCIELPTVKNHVHSILEKLGASSRGEAAARARQPHSTGPR